MKNGKEILVFSIIACAILVLEFFYLPWGSINKDSSTTDIVTGVHIDESITNAQSFTGSSVSQGFTSPALTSSNSFSRPSSHSGSTKVSSPSSISSVPVKSQSYSIDQSSFTGSSAGGGYGGGSSSYSSSSANTSSQSSALSFNSPTSTSFNSMGQTNILSGQDGGVSSQIFGGDQAFEGSSSNDKMKKVSMTFPPADPLEADHIFLLLALCYFAFKYFLSLRDKRVRSANHNSSK
jgi:hypothetical protein